MNSKELERERESKRGRGWTRRKARTKSTNTTPASLLQPLVGQQLLLLLPSVYSEAVFMLPEPTQLEAAQSFLCRWAQGEAADPDEAELCLHPTHWAPVWQGLLAAAGRPGLHWAIWKAVVKQHSIVTNWGSKVEANSKSFPQQGYITKQSLAIWAGINIGITSHNQRLSFCRIKNRRKCRHVEVIAWILLVGLW